MIRYSQLSEVAKETAISEYCRIMKIPALIYRDKIIKWFNDYDNPVLTEEGYFINDTTR